MSLSAEFLSGLGPQELCQILTSWDKIEPASFVYATNPVGYASDILKINLTDDQQAVLNSVRDNRRTLVKASHAIGKTFVANVAANWWYDTREKSIVYVTAPTWKQALGLTFKEVKRFRRGLKLPGRILDSGLIEDADDLKKHAHYIRALNAESGEGFQGEHSAPILIIMEEGVGVPPYIWEAMGGLMTHPACRALIIGNPTDEATQFGEAAASASYNTLSVSVFDHPNIDAELNCQPPPFPDAVRLQWLFEMLTAECERVDAPAPDSFQWWALPHVADALEGKLLPANAERWHYLPTAYFQGRALGIFPTQADENVIPRGWLLDQARLEPAETDLPEIGSDVARFGNDRTCNARRRGPCVFELKELRHLDNIEVTESLRQMAERAAEEYTTATGKPLDAKKVRIKIDTTGGLGTGPYDTLKAEKYAVVAVNSSEKAQDVEHYLNVRSELWFDQRDRVKDRRMDLSRLPRDVKEKLIRELSTPKYKVRSGKKVVEEKAEIKTRLGFSPDLADGCNLAFYNARVARLIGV